MGNHVVGKAIGLAAEHALAARLPGQCALRILDNICKRYKGHDAEFESEDPNRPGWVHPDYERYTDPHPQAALGMLMVEAFSPNGLSDLGIYTPMLDAEHPDEEQACDDWEDKVNGPFCARYKFG